MRLPYAPRLRRRRFESSLLAMRGLRRAIFWAVMVLTRNASVRVKEVWCPNHFFTRNTRAFRVLYRLEYNQRLLSRLNEGLCITICVPVRFPSSPHLPGPANPPDGASASRAAGTSARRFHVHASTGCSNATAPPAPPDRPLADCAPHTGRPSRAMVRAGSGNSCSGPVPPPAQTQSNFLSVAGMGPLEVLDSPKAPPH